ncbi:hypothetical protein TNCV_4615861 [Trichonephila clavipes]|nr:hypothetical protein TNCV_4615861 [Trichonephila clavipes]
MRPYTSGKARLIWRGVTVQCFTRPSITHPNIKKEVEKTRGIIRRRLDDPIGGGEDEESLKYDKCLRGSQHRFKLGGHFILQEQLSDCTAMVIKDQQ